MGTMLEVRGLWAGYTDFVVRDVSFSVAGGELVGILGRNGSGKSTLLRGLSYGLRRRQGQVLVQGEDCAALSPRQRARRMALLPQHTPTYPGLRVEEVLELECQGKALLLAPADIDGISTLRRNGLAMDRLYGYGYQDGAKLEAFLSR